MDMSFNLGSISKDWDLQRTFDWRLVMPHSISGINGMDVAKYCQSVYFGNYNISEVEQLRYGPHQRFFPGLMDINRVSLEFISPINNYVYLYFMEWRYLVVNRDGLYSPKNNYVRDVYVEMFSQVGNAIGRYRLRRCFPTKLPEQNLDQAVEDVVRHTIELSVDEVELPGLNNISWKRNNLP